MSTTAGSLERVEADVPCMKCGYNLRTQLLDGRCPECNAPVGDSVSAWKHQNYQTVALRFRSLLFGALCLDLYGILSLASRLLTEFWPAFDLGTTLWGVYSIVCAVLILLGTLLVIRAKQSRRGWLVCLLAGIVLGAALLADAISSHLPWPLFLVTIILKFLPELLSAFLLFAAVSFMSDLWRRLGTRAMVHTTYLCLLVCGTIQTFIASIWTMLATIPLISRLFPANQAWRSLMHILITIMGSPYYHVSIFTLYATFLIYWTTTAILAKRLMKPRLST